jgi:hypothetical protein
LLRQRGPLPLSSRMKSDLRREYSFSS